MRFELTLAQKGLVLVAVPLIFELVFVAVLAGLLQQAESEIQRALRSKNVIQATNDLMQDIYRTAELLADLDLSRVGKMEKMLTGLIDRTGVETKRLLDLVKDNPHQTEIVMNVERARLQGLSMLAHARRVAKERSIFQAMEEFKRARRTLEPSVRKVAGSLLSLIEEEKKIEAQMPKIQAESRRKVVLVLGAGVLFNILLAVSLAVYFNKGTAKRLAVLVDNTVRLARGQSLNPRLPGNDEIARLDRVFNDMAEALIAAARKERAIVENALDVICSIDAQGKFTAVSPASMSVWGYRPEELIGARYIDLVADEDKDATTRTFQQMMNSQAKITFENRACRKDGALVDLLWSMHWSGAESSAFCVAHDMTERKNIERMKQEFLAMVSHDLRTPLASLQTFLSLLGTGMYGRLSESGQDSLSLVDQDIGRLIRLVNDLLDIEKMETGKLELAREDTSLSSIIERSVQSVAYLADRRNIKLDVQATDAHVHADGDRIVQVIVNLLSNAIKFSPKGGSVKVVVDVRPDCAEVRVMDKGRGIPDKFKNAIFERFKQVDPSDATERRGSGLGLAICKAIVEAHGGTIGVESKEGAGSTFWFRIPHGKMEAHVPIGDSEINTRS
ncbi:MAG TPA: ATP-binding protein [Candidatus Obscuribacterales bacterium]